MGYCEAASLYLNVQRSTDTEPGAPVIFADAIAVLGGSVQDVLIHGFSDIENCFLASLRIRQGDQLIEVDARPSDAISLAVVCDVPILISPMAWDTYRTGHTRKTSS